MSQSIIKIIAIIYVGAGAACEAPGRTDTTTEGYTKVWIRRDGRWQLVAEQITLQYFTACCPGTGSSDLIGRVGAQSTLGIASHCAMDVTYCINS